MGDCSRACFPGACGSFTDACGTLECGECGAPETCGGGGTPNMCGAPRALAPSPDAEASSPTPRPRPRFEVVGSPTTEIRQGASEPPGETPRPIRLLVHGEGFTPVTLVRCEGKGMNLPVSVIDAESSATLITLEVQVPHRTALGPYTVTVTMEAGPSFEETAFTVTPITACAGCAARIPAGFAPGDGTTAHPFGTYQDALAQSATGDTVLLQAGTYSPEQLGAWPVIVGDDTKTARVNMPGGITLRGEGADKTILVGPPPAGATTPAQRVAGIVFGPSPVVPNPNDPKVQTRLEGLSLRGFDVGVLVRDTRALLEDVVIEDAREIGLWGTGSFGAQLTQVTVQRAGDIGVRADAAGGASLEHCRLLNNGRWGVLARGALQAGGGEVLANGARGAGSEGGSGGILIDGEGVRRLDNSDVSFVKIRDNVGDGLVMRGSTAGATMVTPRLYITAGTFVGNSRSAITVGDGVQLFMNTSTVELARDAAGGCTGAGVRLLGTARATIGPGSPITFALAPSGACFALDDLRPPGTGSSRLGVTDTRFTNTDLPLEPAVGCYAGTKDRKWRIANPGSCGSTLATDVGNVVRVFP